MEVRENYSLKNYNTFGIDAKCRYFVESNTESEFLEFVSSYELKPEEVMVLGEGSNFLFTEDFDGTVFYPTIKGIEIVEENEEQVWVRVGAGEVWDDFVAWAVEQGYGGVENLSFIPGHVGAAPVQNVGAYGMEAGDTIERVEAIQIEKARKEVISAADCRFAYRDSIFKREWKNRYIVTYVVFRLTKTPEFRLNYGSIQEELRKLGEVNLKNIRQAIIRIRQAKLPDVKELPNAGSFFKNPIVSRQQAEKLKEKYPELPLYPVDEDRVKLAAGWLIEQCGWKGKNLGKAGVYEKQALILVNREGASGVEVAHLANEVKKSVFMTFGVWIEPEVYVI